MCCCFKAAALLFYKQLWTILSRSHKYICCENNTVSIKYGCSAETSVHILLGTSIIYVHVYMPLYKPLTKFCITSVLQYPKFCKIKMNIINKQDGPVSLTSLPDKFRVSCPFASWKELQYRFSRWPPSWISNQMNLATFWSTSHINTSNEVSSQLAFLFRRTRS